jgi:UrcA family protein
MDSRKLACLLAAGFIGAGLTAAATAQPPKGDVVVKGQRIDPQTQRVVSYADLNLAVRHDQRVLGGRIFRTAGSLCNDLGYVWTDAHSACTSDAVHSTDDQVAEAIDRAKLKMAGKQVGPAVAISMVIGAQ